MNNQSLQFIKISYPIETLLKLIFIILVVTRSSNVILVGFLASFLGMLRMLKMPKFNK